MRGLKNRQGSHRSRNDRSASGPEQDRAVATRGGRNIHIGRGRNYDDEGYYSNRMFRGHYEDDYPKNEYNTRERHDFDTNDSNENVRYERRHQDQEDNSEDTYNRNEYSENKNGSDPNISSMEEDLLHEISRRDRRPIRRSNHDFGSTTGESGRSRRNSKTRRG
jgi:hypothetical protein